MRISDWSSDVCSSDLMMNSEDSGMILGLTYDLLDHYLDQPDFDWPTKWQDWFEARLAEGKAYLDQSRALPAKVGPSLDLARYAGRYRDPWYGDIVIASTAKGLTIDFTSTPLMTGRTKHWQYDSSVKIGRASLREKGCPYV